MVKSRRDLITGNDEVRITEAESLKLKKNIESGSIYVTLTNSLGWKRLMEEYLNPLIDQKRILDCPTVTLVEERAEQRALWKMLEFINHKIKTAENNLERLKKQGG